MGTKINEYSFILGKYEGNRPFPILDVDDRIIIK
jgi:hypothetical protein